MPLRNLELQRLGDHKDDAQSAVFSSDGKTIVSTSNDRTARLWVVDIKSMLAVAESMIQREPPILSDLEQQHFGIER